MLTDDYFFYDFEDVPLQLNRRENEELKRNTFKAVEGRRLSGLFCCKSTSFLFNSSQNTDMCGMLHKLTCLFSKKTCFFHKKKFIFFFFWRQNQADEIGK
jgi:hypothetical protein